MDASPSWDCIQSPRAAVCSLLGSGHPCVKSLYKDSIYCSNIYNNGECRLAQTTFLASDQSFCSGAEVPSGCCAHAWLLQSRLSPSWTYTIAFWRRNSKRKPKERNSSALGLSCMVTSTAFSTSIHPSQSCRLEMLLRLLLHQRW